MGVVHPLRNGRGELPLRLKPGLVETLCWSDAETRDLRSLLIPSRKWCLQNLINLIAELHFPYLLILVILKLDGLTGCDAEEIDEDNRF